MTVMRPADIPLAYAEVIKFLAGGPSLQEIAAFKISAEAQARLRKLLDKNRESQLTGDEQAELDLYEHIEHVMILLRRRRAPRLRSFSSPAMSPDTLPAALRQFVIDRADGRCELRILSRREP